MTLALDQSGYTNNAGSTSLASASITPTVADFLAVAAFGLGGNNASAQSYNNSFTEQANADSVRVSIATRLVTGGSGSYSTTYSWTQSSNLGDMSGIANFSGINTGGSVLQKLANFGTSSASVTPTAPTVGNLLVVLASQIGTLAGITGPTGFTAIGAGIDQGSASGAAGQLYWKVADGSETTVTVNGTAAAKVRVAFIEFPAAATASGQSLMPILGVG